MFSTTHALDIQMSINEVLGQYPSAGALLHACRIDTCCRGQMSLADAATEVGLDGHAIAAEILATAAATDSTVAPEPKSCSCGCSSHR
ncbi:MAG TPA: DUF542 domain-containing protein [Gemmatimonadaceae bacterium]|nr:DUF542 domain-containing protein [Gemmatimonadaceae bacterium]